MSTERVCIVTGGGHGIGKFTALQLADLGHTVVVNDLGSGPHGAGSDEEPAEAVAQKIRNDGGEAMAHFGDASDLEYTQQLIADTLQEYGRIDSVGNFAGILRDNLAYKMRGDQWDDVINVHLRSHFAVMRNLAKHWWKVSRQNDGDLDRQRAFLSVSSGSALGNPGQMNYSAAKAGILGFTRTMALELNRYNVRVNALMPRAHTRLIDSMPDKYIPEGLPEPEDLAPFTSFLLGNESEDVTGCTFLAAGEKIGLVSDPQLITSEVQEELWSAEEFGKRFHETIGERAELTRLSGHLEE